MKRVGRLSGLIVGLVVMGNLFAQNPFDADIVVAADGSGDFTMVQAAFDAVPSNSERPTVIYIKRGLYDQEKLIITSDKINITLIGESREETIISYHIHNCGDLMCPAEDAAKWTGDNIRTAATLTIMGDGFRAENLTIQNTAGPVGQAQAITVRSDKCVFINCDLTGYQDTMYFWNDGNRCYFKGCLVVGRTDYIYGGGIVFFQDCEIRSWGGAYITAPSTAKTQAYGFVFNECTISYALGSPRPGDDGSSIRFGRPWHNYPKVSWLNCEITEKLNPLGWGDKWNMEYADTSTDLHLFEYKNTGPGADMSGRANWAGIKELSDPESQEYTVQKVMAGTDGWDPTAEAPLVQTYNWTGNGATAGWLVPENWDPLGIPANGEAAAASGEITLLADGDSLAADLNLMDTAELKITANSYAAYISAASARFSTMEEVTLNGRIATKDTIAFDITGTLTLNAVLSGVHDIRKYGTGKLILNGDNGNYSGDFLIDSGSVEGAVDNSLGKGAVYIQGGGTLIVGSDNAFQPKSRLDVSGAGKIVLNASVITSEFFIDGTLQSIGEYNASSNPTIISGTGSIIVGRPSTFTFTGASDGNWDNPANFAPALMPLAGETVIVEKEMETTSTVFQADIILKGAGGLRLRGDHSSTGTVYMENGTYFKYNTGGSGMKLNAPIQVDGDVSMVMESGNASGSNLALPGSISGSGKITALNNGKGTLNSGTLLLTGDNSNFFGTWDLTTYSDKYPDAPGYISRIEGKSENAFGSGSIIAAHENRVVLSHARAAGDTLELTLQQSAKVEITINVSVSALIINGNSLAKGVYSATTNPEFFEGTGTISVGSTRVEKLQGHDIVKVYDNSIRIEGNKSRIEVFNILGHCCIEARNVNRIDLDNLNSGIYIIRYMADGESGVIKFYKY